VGEFLTPDEMKELDMAFATMDGKLPPGAKAPMKIGMRVGQLSMVHAVVRAQMAAATPDDPIGVQWPGLGAVKVWQGDERNIAIQQGSKVISKQWRQLQPREMSALMKACVADPKIPLHIPSDQIDHALRALENSKGFRPQGRPDPRSRRSGGD